MTSTDEIKTWFQRDDNVHMATKLVNIFKIHFPGNYVKLSLILKLKITSLDIKIMTIFTYY